MLKLFTREHEVQLAIIREDAGICAREGCGKRLAEGKFAWDHRITSDMYRPGPWQLGEDWFSGIRHADGTPCGDNPDHNYYCYPKPVCDKCGAVDQFDRKQVSYGDWVTCKVCGDENWYSIGD